MLCVFSILWVMVVVLVVIVGFVMIMKFFDSLCMISGVVVMKFFVRKIMMKKGMSELMLVVDFGFLICVRRVFVMFIIVENIVVIIIG